MAELENVLSVPRALRIFQRKRVPATCTAAEVVGNCVYISGPASGSVYQVRQADSSDPAKTPAVGVIVSKSSATDCIVQILGEVSGVFSGLIPGELLYLGTAGVLTNVPGTISQIVGIALSTDIVLVQTEFDISSSGSGITAVQHEKLRQLIHFIEDGPAHGFATGAFKQTVGGLFYTSVVWWESAAMLKKIVEKIVDRTDPVFPPTVTWNVYDTDGVTVLQTIVDTITYLNAAEVSRTRAIA